MFTQVILPIIGLIYLLHPQIIRCCLGDYYFSLESWEIALVRKRACSFFIKNIPVWEKVRVASLPWVLDIFALIVEISLDFS